MGLEVLLSVLPRVLPPEWRVVESRVDGMAYEHRRLRMTVIVSIEVHDHPETGAAERWIHFSIARRDRLPTWEELTEARDLFLGPETDAYQKLARRSEHVNIHARCLHLWVPLDRRLTPDFTRGSGSI